MSNALQQRQADLKLPEVDDREIYTDMKLTAQAFSGSGLLRRLDPAAPTVITEVVGSKFLLVSEGKVASLSGGRQLYWLDSSAVPDLSALQSGDSVVTLGGHADGTPHSAISLAEVSEPTLAAALSAALAACPGASLRDLRSIMQALSPSELAIAGHAVALCRWHRANKFCARCGAPTVSSSAGARRRCSAEPAKHRIYPRTDPVAIGLVESPDGSRALLARSKGWHPSAFSCIAGFVEQGESVEEAVAREAGEEAGVEVIEVEVLGSQPWPIGEKRRSHGPFFPLQKMAFFFFCRGTGCRYCHARPPAIGIHLFLEI
jgi:NADH pyrophosphatase NudC (nudix superfamily)